MDRTQIDYLTQLDVERLGDHSRNSTQQLLGALAWSGEVLSIGFEIGTGISLLPAWDAGLPFLLHGMDRGGAKVEELPAGTSQMSLTAKYGLQLSKEDAAFFDNLAGDLGPVAVVGIRGALQLVRSAGATATASTLGPAGAGPVIEVRAGCALVRFCSLKFW